MSRFTSQQQAKEYLVSRILAEAEREGAPLDEIERKMLYFSETDWTLPGILEVNAEFERNYNNDEYEQKIAGIVRNLEAGATPEEQETWDVAVLKLSEGDHYLLVLIDAAGPSGRRNGGIGNLDAWLPAPSRVTGGRPKGDRLRLVLVAIIISTVLITIMAIADHFR